MGRKLIAGVEKRIATAIMSESYKHGIEAISTKEIAYKLGISETVIFSRYHTKSALLYSIFESAWNGIPPFLIMPLSNTTKEEKAGFEKFKAMLPEILKHKKEIVYCHQFIDGHLGPYEKIVAVQQGSRDSIGEYFKKAIPGLSSLELLQIEEHYIETNLDTWVHIVKGHYPADDNSLLFIYQVALHGYFGYIERRRG